MGDGVMGDGVMGDGVMEDARKLGERNWRNGARNRDSWQKLLKKYIWLNQLSNTTNLWWIDVYYIVINYMFRRLWPSSG
jgi:hypothetical protein